MILRIALRMQMVKWSFMSSLRELVIVDCDQRPDFILISFRKTEVSQKDIKFLEKVVMGP